jgi:methyltransferase family protein
VKHFPEKEDVDYVYGDIHRPSTWKPSGVLKPEMADVIVSQYTFQHLVDPLTALKNTFAILKAGGNLWIDGLVLPLAPHSQALTAEVLCRGITAANGNHGDKPLVLPLSETRYAAWGNTEMCLSFSGLIQKAEANLFDAFQSTVIQGDGHPLVVCGIEN